MNDRLVRPACTTLYVQLDNGGYEAMLFDLLHRDIKGFHPRQIIKTDALSEQQARNLDAFEAWWSELLDDGMLPGGTVGKPNVAPSNEYEVPHGNYGVVKRPGLFEQPANRHPP